MPNYWDNTLCGAEALHLARVRGGELLPRFIIMEKPSKAVKRWGRNLKPVFFTRCPRGSPGGDAEHLNVGYHTEGRLQARIGSLKCKISSETSPLALSWQGEENRYWHWGRTKSANRNVSKFSLFSSGNGSVSLSTEAPRQVRATILFISSFPRFLSIVFLHLSFRTFMHLWITSWRSTRKEPGSLLSTPTSRPYGRSRGGDSKQPAWGNRCLLWPAFPPNKERLPDGIPACSGLRATRRLKWQP